MSDLIFRSSNSEAIEKIKHFAEENVLPECEDLVVSDNICKEFWIEEFDCRYDEELENMELEYNSKERRELLEREFDNFMKNNGWDNTNGFDDWCGYIPMFLNEVLDK